MKKPPLHNQPEYDAYQNHDYNDQNQDFIYDDQQIDPQMSPDFIRDDYQQIEEYPQPTYSDPNYQDDYGYQSLDDQQEEEEIEDTTQNYKKSIFKPRLKKPNFVISVLVNVVRVFVLLVVLVGLAGIGAVLGVAKAYVETAPTLDLGMLGDQDQTSFIYDAQGNLITEYKGIENRRMVSIASMPDYLQKAFVAVEDARFYTHTGVDIKRIGGAFLANLSTGSQQGGSTITQQLIKQTVLSSEVSYKRKIQEAYLAMQLEKQYSKDQILEYYLNTIYLGENYYGVQVAAEGYFGKSNLGELTLRECAIMAGATTNPYYYNPRRNLHQRSAENVDYHAITNNRTDYVLHAMYENQFITWQQYQDALNPQTALVLEKDPSQGSGMYEYAHYVEYAVQDVVNTFLKIEGLENTSENRYKMENKLRTGGYHVRLAIDTQAQNILEETVENWKNYPRLRDPRDDVYRSKNADGTYTEIIQPQVAAVILDYRTGEIKAMVGGRTKPTQRKTLNRATDIRMPVGSTIKPIGVYAPAIDIGASPASIVFNMPIPIPGWQSEKGYPQNYGGGGYVGAQTLRQALTKSHNTATAQALMTMVGVDRSVNYLKLLGVDPSHIDETPFGVSLGSSGISPLEMTVAFGVLANGGEYQQPISFLGISDNGGNVVYDTHANQETRRVFKPSTAWLTIDIMKDVVASGTGRTAKFSGQTIAGKTGTNSDQKGVSFVGVTGYYASYVWIGHDNYKPLSSKSTGNNSVAPLWKEFMSRIHTEKNLPNQDILAGQPEEYNLVKKTTCGVSGQLVTEACYHDQMGYSPQTDYWPADSVPTVKCQMHRFLTVCTESGKQATEYCPAISQGNRGVVFIPQGHPLYNSIDQHGDVLRKYLGEFATVRNTSELVFCDIHGPYTHQGGGDDGYVQQNFIPDAMLLIERAQGILAGLELGSDVYNNLQGAIINLQNVINQESPSAVAVTEAMGNLTNYMAQAQ